MKREDIEQNKKKLVILEETSSMNMDRFTH